MSALTGLLNLIEYGILSDPIDMSAFHDVTFAGFRPHVCQCWSARLVPEASPSDG